MSLLGVEPAVIQLLQSNTTPRLLHGFITVKATDAEIALEVYVFSIFFTKVFLNLKLLASRTLSNLGEHYIRHIFQLPPRPPRKVSFSPQHSLPHHLSLTFYDTSFHRG
jgi:hypothetical protein